MAKIHVTAKRDFIESLVSARPIPALAELIWNGFDSASSSKVEVGVDINDMDGIEAVRVKDNGAGIDPTLIDTLFGGLGESWKKKAYKQGGRALHGKNGKGRFKAFALGERVQWRSTFRRDDGTYTYSITGHLDTIDDFDVTDPVKVSDAQATGTEVVIHNLRHEFKALSDGSAEMELAKIYAAYLTEYPDLSLEFDGSAIDPKSAQLKVADYVLEEVRSEDGRIIPVVLSVIEWKVTTERVLHLCDPNGVALHALLVGPQVRAPGFEFTAYIKSEFFRELDKSNSLVIADLHPDVQTILNSARSKIKAHFRKRLSENQSEVIENWKRENIYPFEEKANLAPVEIAERQVFDILAVNVQSYLPSFEFADQKSRKFTFLLLAQAIRQNPDSVQLIISQVLGLSRSAQDQLADLLKKTSLSSIISSAEIVSNRLDLLNGLEGLIFDKKSKEVLLERDQLHKILENEAWLFHEEFGLAGSELRLEDVLKKHRAVLGPRKDDPVTVDVGGGKTGRVDLMLHKVVQPRSGEYDYLVVELKRPSKKITAEVLTQIEKYAIAVANDERFRDVPARWTFVAISNELDDYAKKKANQRGQPKGMVYNDSDQNITVWARSWADVINDARSKLDFVNQHLSYEADRDSAKRYLNKAHAKFIPEMGGTFAEDDESAAAESNAVPNETTQEES